MVDAKALDGTMEYSLIENQTGLGIKKLPRSHGVLFVCLFVFGVFFSL